MPSFIPHPLDRDILEILIVHGATLDEHDAQGTTALWRAVSSGKSHLVTLLLEFKADSTLTTNQGENALDEAQRRGYAIVV